MTTEPRLPERQRLVRPDLYRDEVTGSLTPAERDAYLGIATLADDEGFTLWRPKAIAAAIYPYVAPARRVHDLEARAAALIAAGLLEVLACGTCAFLPRARRDLVIAGGKQIRQVQAFHVTHTDRSVPIPGDPERSGTSTSSSSSSVSDSGSSTDSESLDVDVARSRETQPNSNGHRPPAAAGRPSNGSRMTTKITNEDLPATLRVVQVPA